MFGSNRLSLPTPLAQEHRPLRLTAESSRSLPTGGCYFATLHQSSENQRCSCQSFHHDRSSPGNACDCGHSACYHAASWKETQKPSEEALNALTERIKKLEETVIKEREIRDCIILRERQAWEREVRVLREALAPFYKSEYDMRRRLLEIEDKVEGNYDEQLRLKDRIMAIDDASMALEKRLEENGYVSCKKRKVSHESNGHDYASVEPNNGLTINGQGVTARPRTSIPIMEPPNTKKRSNAEPDSPRSSGILNLAPAHRRRRVLPTYIAPRRRPISPLGDLEPRSSGFLALELVKPLDTIKVRSDSLKEPGSSDEPGSPDQQDKEESQSPAPVRTPPPGIVPPGPLSLPALLSADGFVHRSRSDELHLPTSNNPPNLMALDVLANVSAARPLVR